MLLTLNYDYIAALNKIWYHTLTIPNLSIKNMETTKSKEVLLSDLGPIGMPSQIFILQDDHGGTLIKDEPHPDDSVRYFAINALFGKVEELGSDINLSVNSELGNSYLLIPPAPASAKISVQFPNGEINFSHNSRRELASAHYACNANSAAAARASFMEAITPFIDHISYLGNVPIHLRLIECYDPKNKIRSYNYVIPHPAVLIDTYKAAINDELLPIYALYREAKNASSPFYRFLCYYKILEGIYKHIRPKLRKIAKQNQIQITIEREMFPDNDELSKSHPQLIGKSIKEVFDSRFYPMFRNEVAHYFLDTGRILNVSHAQALNKFSFELLAIESCARIVIATEESYLSQLITN